MSTRQQRSNLPTWPDHIVNAVFYIDNRNRNTCASALSKDSQEDKPGQTIISRASRAASQRMQRLVSQRPDRQEAAETTMNNLQLNVERYRTHRELFRSLRESMTMCAALSAEITEKVVQFADESKSVKKTWVSMQEDVNELKLMIEVDERQEKRGLSSPCLTEFSSQKQTANRKGGEELVLPSLSARKNGQENQQKKIKNQECDETSRPSSLPSIFKVPKKNCAQNDAHENKPAKSKVNKFADVRTNKATSARLDKIAQAKRQEQINIAREKAGYLRRKTSASSHRPQASDVNIYVESKDNTTVDLKDIEAKEVTIDAQGEILMKMELKSDKDKFREILNKERRRATAQRRKKELLESCIIKAAISENGKSTDQSGFKKSFPKIQTRKN